MNADEQNGNPATPLNGYLKWFSRLTCVGVAVNTGFILPALIPLVGAGRAILMAGLYFGLLHWARHQT